MTPEERDRLEGLLGAVESTAPSEIDCESTLDQLAAYFESLQGGSKSQALLRVEQHLSVCPCCAQELQLLIEALGGE